MRVYIKGLNTCVMRKQKVLQYMAYITANGHMLVNSPEEADYSIIWTCSFRQDVRDNSLSEIQRYVNGYDTEVIVAGCMPDIDPEFLADGFDGKIVNWKDDALKLEAIFGDKIKLDDMSSIFIEPKLYDDVAAYKKSNPQAEATFYDQFIKLLISEGCNYSCTYCSERLMFPKFKSFSMDSLFKKCELMVNETGFTKVALFADSLGEYGKDIGTDFPSLLRRLRKIHRELQFVLFNFNPTHFISFFDEMKELFEENSFFHLNLPIQSASDRILQLMQRPYSRIDIDRIYSFLNDIKFVEFDTHIIVGFPGETEEEFQETVNFVSRHCPKYVLLSKCLLNKQIPASFLPGRIDSCTMQNRIQSFEQQIKPLGIICNSDGSDHIQDRFRRLNKS
ncbi:MAG: radical SAM protein [Desulfovibrio sp.]|nr:radical SAM protein [Desulfovibrio sp.]MBI4959178.1 radical SAM protein [Desulfovibrio sp.]